MRPLICLGFGTLLTFVLVLSSQGVSPGWGQPSTRHGRSSVFRFCRCGPRVSGAGGMGLGASVQAPWIAYAVLTGQYGFIPGCTVSAVV
ncbi:MAG: hypothetical protein ACRDWS_03770 [Acidimicrobiia bacterium]